MKSWTKVSMKQRIANAPNFRKLSELLRLAEGYKGATVKTRRQWVKASLGRMRELRQEQHNAVS